MVSRLLFRKLSNSPRLVFAPLRSITRSRVRVLSTPPEFPQAYQGTSTAAQVSFFDPASLQQDLRLRNKPVGVPLFNLSGFFLLWGDNLMFVGSLRIESYFSWVLTEVVLARRKRSLCMLGGTPDAAEFCHGCHRMPGEYNKAKLATLPN
jgi:hypothetical protein